MARFPLHGNGMRAGALAAAGLVLGALPAAAQQVPELRGAVQETAIAEDLFARPVTPPDALSDEPPSTIAEPAARPRPRQETQDELTTGTVRAQRVDTLEEDRNLRAGPEDERVGAIEGLGPRTEDDPFAPLGIRAGTFVFTPRLDQGIGWTSNASASAGGRAALFSETALRLDAVSDWSRHSAALRAEGAYRRSLSGERISEVEGAVDGELRLDLGYEFSALAAAGYRVRPQSASAPSAVADVVSQPLRHTFSGTTGLARDVGRLRVGITGDVVRDIYADARLSDDTVVSQADRNATLATATLRLGYELSPALRPFVEGEAGRRFHDRKVDSAGYERSADRYSVRAGVELDLREKLSGEFSAGWLTERPDDDRLEAISGLIAQGRLGWSPVRGTLVELAGSTEVESTTAPGESGSLLYSGSLAVNRALRADLTGRALVGMDWRDYSGSGAHDLVLRGEASLTWWMNRNLGVTGRARHEVQRSSDAVRDYDATSVYLGMTFQR